jgi:nickel transport protein
MRRPAGPPTRTRTPLALAALAVALAAPAGARAHGALEVDVERSAAGIAVRARHHGGEPLADAFFVVVSPAAPGRAHDEGRTDRHGWLVFVPDAAGTWTVRVVDASGHGKVEEIAVPADAVVTAATAPPAAAGAGPGAAPEPRTLPPAPPPRGAAESRERAGSIYRVIGGLAVIMLAFFVVFAVLIRRPRR